MPKEEVSFKLSKAEIVELANALMPIYEEYKKVETLLIQGKIIEGFLANVNKQIGGTKK